MLELGPLHISLFGCFCVFFCVFCLWFFWVFFCLILLHKMRRWQVESCWRMNGRARPVTFVYFFGWFFAFLCDFFCCQWDVGKLRAMGEWMVELGPLHLSPTSQTPSRFNWLSIEIKHHLDLTEFLLKSSAKIV